MIREIAIGNAGEKANEKAGGKAGGKAAGTTCKEGDEKAVEGSVRKEGFLAELGNAPGTVKMVLVSPKAVEEKSQESIDNAMFVIQEISKKVMDTVEASRAEHRPSQVQLAFGLRLTTDGRAVITKSEKETNMKVTLVWKRGDETASQKE